MFYNKHGNKYKMADFIVSRLNKNNSLQDVIVMKESFTNSTQKHQDEGLLDFVAMCLLSFALAVSIGSIIFGLVSWITLKKWRQFRHYVFLCLLLTNVLNWVSAPISAAWPAADTFCFEYAISSFTYWLIIVTVMFFIEFVKVFTDINTIKHKYLYANIFGWLMPLLFAIFQELFDYVAFVILSCILVVINSVLYFKVLLALCGTSHVKESLCKNVILSSFIFAMTGIAAFVPLTVATVLDIDIAPAILCYAILILLINVFFLMLKSHREIWSEYRQRAKNSRI